MNSGSASCVEYQNMKLRIRCSAAALSLPMRQGRSKAASRTTASSLSIQSGAEPPCSTTRLHAWSVVGSRCIRERTISVLLAINCAGRVRKCPESDQTCPDSVQTYRERRATLFSECGMKKDADDGMTSASACVPHEWRVVALSGVIAARAGSTRGPVGARVDKSGGAVQARSKATVKQQLI